MNARFQQVLRKRHSVKKSLLFAGCCLAAARQISTSPPESWSSLWMQIEWDSVGKCVFAALEFIHQGNLPNIPLLFFLERFKSDPASTVTDKVQWTTVDLSQHNVEFLWKDLQNWAPHLTRLELRHSGLTDDSASHLNRLSSLEYLDVSCNVFSPIFFSGLTRPFNYETTHLDFGLSRLVHLVSWFSEGTYYHKIPDLAILPSLAFITAHRKQCVDSEEDSDESESEQVMDVSGWEVQNHLCPVEVKTKKGTSTPLQEHFVQRSKRLNRQTYYDEFEGEKPKDTRELTYQYKNTIFLVRSESNPPTVPKKSVQPSLKPKIIAKSVRNTSSVSIGGEFVLTKRKRSII